MSGGAAASAARGGSTAGGAEAATKALILSGIAFIIIGIVTLIFSDRKPHEIQGSAIFIGLGLFFIIFIISFDRWLLMVRRQRQ